MSLLPPVGWADVATKHDLHELERRLDHRFEAVDERFKAVDLRFEELERRLDHRFQAVDHRFEAMHHEFESLEHKLTGRIEHVARTQLFAMIGAMMTFTSLVLAAVILSR